MNEMEEQRNSVSFSNRQLYRLILPLIIEQFLAITVGLADSIMVASVGEAAVSAVSLVDSVNTLVFFGFAALATGGAVVCGQYIGCRDLDRANASARQLLIFIAALAAVITAALYLAKGLILHGLFGKIEADVMAYADTYFIIVEASIPFIGVVQRGSRGLSRHGKFLCVHADFHRDESAQCRRQRGSDLRLSYGRGRRGDSDAGVQNFGRGSGPVAAAQ